MNTKQKGEVSEAKVLSFLSSRDVDIFLPFGENTRSDMVILENHQPERVQIKTGNIKDGSVRFSCSKVNSNRNGSKRTNYEGEVDSFIVYCPDNDGHYYVPIEDANKASMWLRIDESMGDNGKVKWAENYLLSDRFNELS